MAQVQKIDSNRTGLRIAEEASLGVLPGTPVWYPYEPNSYDNLGGEITTLVRNPINSSRQRQKGVVVDLDAAGGFQSDLTQENLENIMQGFFFADLRRKGEEVPTVVDGTNDEFDVASTTGFNIGSLVYARDLAEAANNGLHLVNAVTINTSIGVDTDLAAEASAPTDSSLVVVGHEFAASELDVDVSGDLPRITSNATAAAATLTLTPDFAPDIADGDVVEIGGVYYSFESGTIDAGDGTVGTPYKVDIGANDAGSLVNLVAAINASGVSGTTYSAGLVANSYVTGVVDSGTEITVTAKVSGLVGNDITVTETAADLAWSGPNLMEGGTGVDLASLGLVPGEWIWIGDAGTGEDFVNAENNGWARVKVIGADYLELDKTSDTMVVETGTGLTIRLYFGRVLKNEADHADIIRRSYQLERTLGAPDDSSPNALQSEYLVGSVPNTVTFNFQTAEKITVDLAFVATDNEQRTAGTGVKSGTRPTLVSGDAYDTSNDFSRLKMTILDPVDSNPTALFAFLTDFTLAINNNVSPNKAISVLGAFDVTAGQFNVDGNATAYFSNVTAVAAVRANSDVTMDFAVVKARTVGLDTIYSGILVDIPLMTLGDGRLNVEQDQPITLPLAMPAAADRVFNHTLLMQFFDYLPVAADAG